MSNSIGSPRFSVLRAHLQQAASHHQRGGDASSSSSSSSSSSGAKDPIWRPMQSSVPRSTRPLGSGIFSKHVWLTVSYQTTAAVGILSEATSHVSIQTPASVCSLMTVHNSSFCWVCIPRF